MTGTADTEAEEFAKIYKLDVNVIPTNRQLVRVEEPDTVYRTEREKYEAIVNDIIEKQNVGPAGAGRHGLDREVRAALDDAQAPRHQARGAEREIPRAGSRDRRAGGPQGHGHHRDEHGGPRHGHPARRQRRVHGPPAVAGRGEVAEKTHARAGALRGRRRVRLLLPHRQLLSRPARRLGAHLRVLQAAVRRRSTTRSSASAACTSSAPSGTRRGASTTSCAAAPAVRATRARRASTCRSKTT